MRNTKWKTATAPRDDEIREVGKFEDVFDDGVGLLAMVYLPSWVRWGGNGWRGDKGKTRAERYGVSFKVCNRVRRCG